MGKLKSTLLDQQEAQFRDIFGAVDAVGYNPADTLDKMELFENVLYMVRSGGLNGHPVQIADALCVELGFRHAKKDAILNAAEKAANL